MERAGLVMVWAGALGGGIWEVSVTDFMILWCSGALDMNFDLKVVYGWNRAWHLTNKIKYKKKPLWRIY